MLTSSPNTKGMHARCAACGCGCGVATNDSSKPPEAVLEGLAMAGLVGILRQLGDLAELSAEVFDGLQEQVMAVSGRGRRLAAQAMQLQCQLNHADAAAAPPIPNAITTGRRLKAPHDGAAVVVGDVPRFIVNHIKRCRGPPSLSLLDRFDAEGHGACFKRYTDPSFFRTHYSASKLQEPEACCTTLLVTRLKTMETRPAEFQTIHSESTPDSAHAFCRSETEKASVGFLSMLRQLKHRQAAGSVSPGLKLQMHQSCIHSNNYCEPSAAERRGRDSSGDHSDTDSSSPQLHMEKANENLQGTNCYSDAGSDYVGICSELERTSSFEAWLSPGAHSATHTQESSRPNPTCSSHAVASNGPRTDDTVKANKQGVSSRRHSWYKGSIEMIASRVGSLPRKLCMKQQHDPLSDSSRSLSDAGGHRCNGVMGEAFLPVLAADAVFSIQDGPSDSNQCSGSGGPGDPRYAPDSSDVLFPRVPRTGGCMVDGSLHVKPTGVLPENFCSGDTKVGPQPLLPIPPMQWLSVKAHTGPVTYRNTFGKDPVPRAELPEPAIHSYVAGSETAVTNQQSGAEVHSEQEPTEDSDKDMQVADRPAEELTEGHQVFYPKGPESASSRGNVASDSEANKHRHSNAGQADSASGQGDENVFFCAVEQLARMSPPWVPRPKHPLPEVVESHDRVTLRNGPSPIHLSRSILDTRTALLQQIKDKSFSLKPVSGTSCPSPESVTGSPTNARVATILQRADDMRQAHAHSNEVDGEGSWSDFSD